MKFIDTTWKMNVTEYFRNSSASPGMMGMALLACLVASTLLLAVYRFTLHPLAKFPGPRLAHISKAWLFFEEMGGYGHEHILELHEKHGMASCVLLLRLCRTRGRN